MLFCCCDPCPDCTGSTCCGGDYPRSGGECCEDVWRMPGEGTCCNGVWYATATPGECCGGVWHTNADSGDCCGGVWHPFPEGQGPPGPYEAVSWPAEECPEGTIYARWGTFYSGVYQKCCDCIADQVFDPRAGEHVEGYPPPGAYVQTETVIEDICCDICPGPIYLPFDAYGNNVGCLGTCCADEDCSRLLQSQCAPGVHPTHPDAFDYWWTPGSSLDGALCCADNPCLAPCCVGGDLVEVATFTVAGEVLVGEWTLTFGAMTFTFTANEGATAEDVAAGLADAVVFQATATGTTIAVTVQSAGLGTITPPGGEPQPPTSSETKLMSRLACLGFGGTRTPSGDCGCKAGETCCETATSSGTLLTFNKPSQFSGTVRVTVTGTTTGPILVYDTPFGEAATPSKKCPFTHTFPLCHGSFNISPLPCGGTFHRVDVEVCYTEEATSTETFDFQGCNGPISLGACPTQCETTLLYTGAGLTSSAAISLYRDSTIEANGTGPLVLTGNITPVASCVETLTLTGTSTAANEIAGVIGNSASDLSVRKTGTGTWWLSGLNAYKDGLVVLDGTVVIAASSDGVSSPFGGNNKMAVVGDAAATSGTAALLLAAGDTISQSIIVPSGSGQKVVFGGLGSGSFTGAGTITLGRNVTFQAATGSTVIFENKLAVSGGAVSLTVGSAGNDGTVRLASFPAGVPVSVLGSIAVVAGTLQTGATGQLAAAIPVTLGSSTASATFDLQGFTQRQSNLSFTGTGSSVIASTGTLRLFNNAGTLTALVNVLDGTGHEISSKVAIDHNSVLDVAASAKLVISGVISNGTTAARTLTKDGDGTLEFTAANTYTGTTTINSGTLRAGSLTAFGTGGITVNAGGTLDKNGYAITNSITNNGGTVLP